MPKLLFMPNHRRPPLVDALESSKSYCAKHEQEYLIVYVIGDHGWHLGEQGIEAKFGPWQQSVANAAILVSSDDSLLKRGSVRDDLIEFVDYLDGFSLFDILSAEKPLREYVLGGTTVAVGPREYLHTERFRFSMRTRPFQTLDKPGESGKSIEWALKAPAKDVEMVLYDLKTDPLERNNRAYDPEYQKLANWFRQKLGKIVLGDGRVECDWSQPNTYSLSNFHAGADDKKADIPAELIP